MSKMQMAHDYAMKHIQEGWDINYDVLVVDAWQYADAMQAEADKRNKAEAEQKRKEVREILNDANTFIEREGWHFDDVEWQPDWSQAPDEAKYWAMDKDGSANFFKSKPEITNGNGWDFGGVMQSQNSHAYTGHWQDSLRKRPEALHPEVDWRVAPSWANWWAIRQDSSGALWCVSKPTVTEDCFLSHGGCGVAPSFGFTGNHIVERPQ